MRQFLRLCNDDHYTTGTIGKTAQKVYRERAIITEKGKGIVDTINDDFMVFLKVIWLVINADNEIRQQEINLINEISNFIADDNEKSSEDLNVFSTMVYIDTNKTIEELKTLDKDTQKHILDAACTAAVIDGKVHKNEISLLKEIAFNCGLSLDKNNLKIRNYN